MRKILICLIGAIILSNCDIKVKESHAQNSGNSNSITVDHYTIDGMDYAVFTVEGKLTNGRYGLQGISVVNVTRDKLQCEIIRSNLKNIKYE